MSEIRNKEFLILSKSKELLFDLDDILENVPRKDFYYKDKIKEYNTELIYSILMINNLSGSSKVKNTYFSKIFTDVSLIDMYIERLYKKQYIAESTTKKIIVKLTEINKMCSVWRKNSEES